MLGWGWSLEETTPVAWECRKTSGPFQLEEEGRLLRGGDIWILHAGWDFARCKWDKDIPCQESSSSRGKETRKCSGHPETQISPRGWREGASMALHMKGWFFGLYAMDGKGGH